MKGKAKEDFEKWFRKRDYIYKELFYVNGYEVDVSDVYDKLPESMQWGVIVDFFDSVGMNIYIKPTSSTDVWSVYIDDFGRHILDDYLFSDSRQEARTKAIEKANEIYNRE